MKLTSHFCFIVLINYFLSDVLNCQKIVLRHFMQFSRFLTLKSKRILIKVSFFHLVALVCKLMLFELVMLLLQSFEFLLSMPFVCLFLTFVIQLSKFALFKAFYLLLASILQLDFFLIQN
jgi:hypothetical protein